MKKRDFILMIGIIAAAVIVWLTAVVFLDGSGGSLRITVDGHVYGMYSLDQDIEIAIGDSNICQIQNGSVSMITADCPDKVCVHSLDISKQGQTIICMPNRVVLEIVDGDMSEVDTISE